MIYRFGVFEFRPETADLWRDGIRVRLEPQPARALTLLLERAGDLVTRDEMRARLWGEDTSVDFDRGLAYAVGQVRTALGDSAENPRFVQTVPRRGYRFIAPVHAHEAPERPANGGQATADRSNDPVAEGSENHVRVEPAPDRSRRAWLVAALIIATVALAAWVSREWLLPERPIVAVALFDNETGQPEYDRIAAGAADIMVHRLTGLGPDIGIIGNVPILRVPRSSRDPAAIRQATGAGYLVFGQVQTDGDGLRMVTHLIRLDDDTHLWVTRVTRPPSDLDGVEDIVAERLARAVRQHVIDRDPSAPRFTP
jgi:DNA-binding winged helix-turn-helix (wHTH) protein/TolB-like protein